MARLNLGSGIGTLVCGLFAVALVGSEAIEDDGVLRFKARSRQANETAGGKTQVEETETAWKASETAVIICDMWDEHWCQGATRRVGEMVPRMNQTVKRLREQGAFVIHAPSGVLGFYSKSSQRRRAVEAANATPPVKIEGWCHLDKGKEGALPIDDSDGGCDCEPRCAQGNPWTRQHAGLEIYPADAITDSGQEAYNMMTEKNVVMLGVHTNMCVLGRSFGIRQMTRLGKHVALVRDLTDTMYNSRMRPFVPHERGTDLVVEHVETHWCPSVTSDDLLGEGE
jgi:nicotinamidase-related amidase